MSEERYYVREQPIDKPGYQGRGPTRIWWIRDRLYNCRDIARIAPLADGHIGARARANSLCIRLNKEYEEWLQQPSA